MSGEGNSGFGEYWRRRFEHFARTHDDDAGVAGWSRNGLAVRLRKFQAVRTPTAAGRRWLDAGSGMGTYSRVLAAEQAEVYALDYSVATVAKASTAEANRGRSIRWCVGDATRLPFRDGQFDGVLCFGVLQAVPDSAVLVASLSAAIGEGGQLWIDGLNRWSVNALWDRFKRRLRGRRAHLRYESAWRLVRLVRAQGFEDVRLHWMPIFPASMPRLQGMLESRWAGFALRHLGWLLALACHSFIVTATRPGPAAAGVGADSRPSN